MTTTTRADLVRLWTEKEKAAHEAAPYQRKAEAASEAYWLAYHDFHKDDPQHEYQGEGKA